MTDLPPGGEAGRQRYPPYFGRSKSKHGGRIQHSLMEGVKMAITFDDAFPQRFLRVDDVAQPLTMEILRVVSENVFGENKYVVCFTEHDRALILNPAPFQQIAKITGS